MTSDLLRRTRRLIVLGILSVLGHAAHAEGRLRIADQFGIAYLPLYVAQAQGLIQKHGKAAGIDIQVEYIRLSGGAAINDALLAGQIDIGSAGLGPLFTLWDRTRGKQDVKGVASLGNFPYYLVTTNPDVRTLADLGPKDRIAVPAVGVSVQARLLQFAAARQWGDAAYDRLDAWTVALPHPDAAAALIKGGTEITAHFGNPPFQEQVLAANPRARILLDSYDLLGGPSTATALYATTRFREDNPKTYAAFVAALDEAARFIQDNREAAADIYLSVSGARTPRDLLLAVLAKPEIEFLTTPQRTLTLGRFLHRVGALRHAPVSVTDYFFDAPHTRGGS